jgi:hypothetical protein
MYCVSKKEGADIPGLLGQFYEPFHGVTEYLLLGLDLQADEGDMELTLFTTNPDAITARPTGQFYLGNEKLRITRFHLSQNQRAYGTYGDDAMLMEISENWDRLTILFYEGQGRYASNLLRVLEHGLLEDRVA